MFLYVSIEIYWFDVFFCLLKSLPSQPSGQTATIQLPSPAVNILAESTGWKRGGKPWVISHVPMFHITQPLGINGLLFMATIFGDVQYSQVMGHLPTPQAAQPPRHSPDGGWHQASASSNSSFSGETRATSSSSSICTTPGYIEVIEKPFTTHLRVIYAVLSVSGITMWIAIQAIHHIIYIYILYMFIIIIINYITYYCCYS